MTTTGDAPAPSVATETPTSCRVHTRLYRDGRLALEGFPVADISDYLDGEDDVVVWLDLLAPTREDLGVIPEEFGLHPLAVDDALNDRQRPKLDRYSTYLFLNAYDVTLDDATGELTTAEISAFVTRSALVTVRKDPSFDIGQVVARWDATDARGVGVGFLLHGLVDHVVDGHFAAVQVLDESIDGLEDLLFSDRPRARELQRRTFELRKSLVGLRRVVLPMREVVNSLMRRDLGVVDEQLMPYYQDVYDHVLRASEWTESLRDLVATILETNLTIQSNRLNEVMRRLSAWAAIIAVPTAITGFYGQNVPYPGYETRHGFWVSVVLLVVCSGGLYGLFKRQHWL